MASYGLVPVVVAELKHKIYFNQVSKMSVQQREKLNRSNLEYTKQAFKIIFMILANKVIYSSDLKVLVLCQPHDSQDDKR